MCFYGEDSHGWNASRCLLFGCEDLEELADVTFQAVVTPIGQEGMRLLLFFN